MDIRDLRAWMYDRKVRKYLTPEFLNGVEHFVDVAIQYSASINESLIRCPCKRCGNKQYLNPSDVKAFIAKDLKKIIGIGHHMVRSSIHIILEMIYKQVRRQLVHIQMI
jgi:hypothetical protein